MLKWGALAAILTIGAPLTALSQSHTAEDEAACTPDVIRLCQQFIPRRQEIIGCLRERRSELGAECFRVFSRPQSSQQLDQEQRPRRRPAAKQHSPN
jgi:hypothetical protein